MTPEAAVEDALKEVGRAAFRVGNYRDAFAQHHSAILTRSIRWFREEGVGFQKPPPAHTPTELIVGLAFAANSEVRERGEDASPRLEMAAALLAAVAELRIALDTPIGEGRDAHQEWMALVTILSAQVGQADMLMNRIELGWFDKLAELEALRERRRLGAAMTQEKKASAKQTALNEAVQIVGRNQTLSNEEVARKLLAVTKLPTTIRTATEWVRGWRREGFLPPQQLGGR